MPLVIELPDEIVRAMQLPESEKQRRAELELACGLYAQGILDAGSAARLAGLERLEFWREAALRGIPRQYSEQNLREDIDFANSGQ